MVWLIDDLAETALGPWGIAVAVGVGVAGIARRTLVPDLTAAPSRAAPVLEGTSVPVASVPTIDRSTPSAQSATHAVTARIGIASAAAGAAVSRMSSTLAGGTSQAGARVQGVTGTVKGRVQTALADVGDYWHDLYAEAHAEWEHGRSQPVPAIITPGPAAPASAVILDAAGEPIPTGTRVRGANGRYGKETV